MGNQKQQTEWLANAEFCHKMAERSNDPVLRARWLTLAQQWMELCERAAESQTDRKQFETAVEHNGNGDRRGSASMH